MSEYAIGRRKDHFVMALPFGIFRRRRRISAHGYSANFRSACYPNYSGTTCQHMADETVSVFFSIRFFISFEMSHSYINFWGLSAVTVALVCLLFVSHYTIDVFYINLDILH